MCAAAVIISRCWVDAHALVQLSVQQKYDFQNIEKYGVLGGKKYCRKTWDLLSSRAAAARWRGGDGCSLPATHQIGPSTISNISGNSWDLFINVLRVFWTLTLHWGRRFAPPSCARLDCRHCIWWPFFEARSIFENFPDLAPVDTGVSWGVEDRALDYPSCPYYCQSSLF